MPSFFPINIPFAGRAALNPVGEGFQPSLNIVLIQVQGRLEKPPLRKSKNICHSERSRIPICDPEIKFKNERNNP